MIKKVAFRTEFLSHCFATMCSTPSVYICPPIARYMYRRSGNFHVKNNFMVSFDSRNFLTVDDYNVDERLESSWHLVYFQVSGEPGIAHCSRRSDIYLGECGLARKLIH